MSKNVVVTMKEFTKMRAALEEHLDAINENSSEIQAVLDYVQEVDLKIDKLAQRLEQMQLAPVDERFIQPLTQTERNLFLVLYTEEVPLSFTELAEKAELSGLLVPECISTLVHKGVPLIRSYARNQIFFRLDPRFKELQAKENVVNLSLQSFME
jgi:hypothetical protein